MKGRMTIILLIGLLGCHQSDNDLTIANPKIKAALDRRKAEYKNEILTNCAREVYEKAKVYVDSVIAAEINYQLSDSIVFPPKPIKPPSPGPIIIADTIRARPMFGKQ